MLYFKLILLEFYFVDRENFDIQLYKISYNSKKRTRVWNYHIRFKISQLIVFAGRMWHNLHSLADVYENINTNSVAIVHELRYIIGMNIEKLAVKLRVNLDASRRPRCLRAETCCGQLSSPFLPPPYSPIAATSPAKLYEYSRLSGAVTMSRSQRRSRASASDSHAERKAARKGRGNNGRGYSIRKEK